MNPNENVNTPHRDPRGGNQRGGNPRRDTDDNTSREQPGPGRDDPSKGDDERENQKPPRR
jgi:hypothetical protein